MPTTGPSKEDTLKPVLVRLTLAMRDQIRQTARAEERTQAQVIRRALRLYLEGAFKQA